MLLDCALSDVSGLKHLLGPSEILSPAAEQQLGVSAKIKEAIPQGVLTAHFLYNELNKDKRAGHLVRRVREVEGNRMDAAVSISGLDGTTTELHSFGGRNKVIRCDADGEMYSVNKFEEKACMELSRVHTRAWQRMLKINKVGDDELNPPIAFHDFTGSPNSFFWEYTIAEVARNYDPTAETDAVRDHDESSDDDFFLDEEEQSEDDADETDDEMDDDDDVDDGHASPTKPKATSEPPSTSKRGRPRRVVVDDSDDEVVSPRRQSRRTAAVPSSYAVSESESEDDDGNDDDSNYDEDEE